MVVKIIRLDQLDYSRSYECWVLEFMLNYASGESQYIWFLQERCLYLHYF